MGVSTDGILVFGIPLEEGIEFPEVEGYGDDFGEYVYDARREDPNFPVDLVTHCHHEYPMYILAVSGTETTASRGYPQKIDGLPEVSAAQIDRLRAFADAHDLGDYCEGEPGWYLCSMWG